MSLQYDGMKDEPETVREKMGRYCEYDPSSDV